MNVFLCFSVFVTTAVPTSDRQSVLKCIIPIVYVERKVTMMCGMYQS